MESKRELNPLLAGALIAAAVVASSLVIMLASSGNASPQGGWISYLIIIVSLVIAINRFGAARNHQASFGELFSYGFKATTMIVLLFVGFLLIIAITSPELKQKTLEATQMELERKKMTDSEIENFMALPRKYFWVVFIGTAMFLLVLVGAVGSLIGAALTRKEPKNPFEQTGA